MATTFFSEEHRRKISETLNLEHKKLNNLQTEAI